MPTVNVNLLDDLVNAAIDVVTDDASPFLPALAEGAITEELKIEYARPGLAGYLSGPNGRCEVYIAETQSAGGNRTFEGSGKTTFTIRFKFDLIETKTMPKRGARIIAAMRSAFGDLGIAFFTALDDSGSNLLGDGLVEMGDVRDVYADSRGPANVILEADVLVTVWHVLPLVYEVEEP